MGYGIGDRGNEVVEEVKAGVGTFKEFDDVDGESKSCEAMEDDDGICCVKGGRLCIGAAAD